MNIFDFHSAMFAAYSDFVRLFFTSSQDLTLAL